MSGPTNALLSAPWLDDAELAASTALPSAGTAGTAGASLALLLVSLLLLALLLETELLAETAAARLRTPRAGACAFACAAAGGPGAAGVEPLWAVLDVSRLRFRCGPCFGTRAAASPPEGAAATLLDEAAAEDNALISTSVATGPSGPSVMMLASITAAQGSSS